MSRPNIKIDPLTRDAMKWNTWHGLSTTMIDKQPLSVAEKRTHLQTLTTGKANEAITGFLAILICTSLQWKNLSDDLDVQITLLAISLPNYRHKDHPQRITKTLSWNFQPFLTI